MINEIANANAKIDLNVLEAQLEQQDHSAPKYYGGADLSHAQVVSAATGAH